MKRSIDTDAGGESLAKKQKIADAGGESPTEMEKIAGGVDSPAEMEMIAAGVEAADLGEDLVIEVLKRADAKTLAAAACVSQRWRRMAEDERIWEAVCTRQWANIGCGGRQLRSVVLALGGFRRLHSLYLMPLLNPAGRSPPPSRRPARRWGKDEVQLSLSLLSIGYFEKMNFNFKRGGAGC